MDWEAVFWFAVMVLFIVVEASTVTLVSVWFAAGALVAMFAALLGGSLLVQIFAFLGTAIVMLIFLRDVVRKRIAPTIIPTNVDSVIGSVGIVTTPVNNVAALGRVEIAGMEWSARSTTGKPLPEGAQVRVDKIEGVKVFVSLAEEPAQVK